MIFSITSMMIASPHISCELGVAVLSGWPSLQPCISGELVVAVLSGWPSLHCSWCWKLVSALAVMFLPMSLPEFMGAGTCRGQ